MSSELGSRSHKKRKADHLIESDDDPSRRNSPQDGTSKKSRRVTITSSDDVDDFGSVFDTLDQTDAFMSWSEDDLGPMDLPLTSASLADATVARRNIKSPPPRRVSNISTYEDTSPSDTGTQLQSTMIPNPRGASRQNNRSNNLAHPPEKLPQTEKEQSSYSSTVCSTDNSMHSVPTGLECLLDLKSLADQAAKELSKYQALSHLQSTQDSQITLHYKDPKFQYRIRRPPHIPRIVAAVLLLVASVALRGPSWQSAASRVVHHPTHAHIIPPRYVWKEQQGLSDATSALNTSASFLSDITLRDFLMSDTAGMSGGFHLGMAPAFFGFYGYLGALAAWEDAMGSQILTKERMRSVTGASAGAMTAVLLATGIPPREAAEFCGTMTVDQFADFPGFGGVFRGDKFERIMRDFYRQYLGPDHSMRLEDTTIPVSVSAFDIQTMKGHILRRGNMARAARASATFPLLFQPVGWQDDDGKDYVFIDGGPGDLVGLRGLDDTLVKELSRDSEQRLKVVNMVVGDYLGGVPPGAKVFSPSVAGSVDLVSITIRNLPACGPWAMDNGPRAVEAAFKAMTASLDTPLYRGQDDNHYELHIDASLFVDK